MLHPFAHPVACCWMLLRVIAQSLKPVKLFSQQLPTFHPFAHHCQHARNNSQHCRRNNVGSCCVRLHAALHLASVCTPCCMLLCVVAQSLKPVKLLSQQLPKFLLFCDRRSVAQQCWSLTGCIFPTILQVRQHCWELLHPFAHHYQHGHNNSQHCWPNNRLGIDASDCT